MTAPRWFRCSSCGVSTLRVAEQKGVPADVCTECADALSKLRVNVGDDHDDERADRAIDLARDNEVCS